jgi:hypothetical protein
MTFEYCAEGDHEQCKGVGYDGSQCDCPCHVWPKEPSVSEAIRRSKAGLPWDHHFSSDSSKEK